MNIMSYFYDIINIITKINYMILININKMNAQVRNIRQTNDGTILIADIVFWDNNDNDFVFPINVSVISSKHEITREFLNFMRNLTDIKETYIKKFSSIKDNFSFFYKDKCTNYYSQDNNCNVYKINYDLSTAKISFITYNSSDEFAAVKLNFEINENIYNALNHIRTLLHENLIISQSNRK
jgi:hypothetical protein